MNLSVGRRFDLRNVANIKQLKSPQIFVSTTEYELFPQIAINHC